MKVFFFIYLLLILFVLQAKAKIEHSFDIITYNIRYDSESDSPNWNLRKKHVVDLLLFYQSALFGVQEALHHQLQDMDDAMQGYSWVGVGRDDGKEAGEYSAIFYKEDLFDVLETETFWLSLTPEKPSKSWDAALPRVCTWAKFNHRPTNSIFFVFNTHFDHIGSQARFMSTQLIIEKIKDIAGESPFILMGDFNFSPVTEPYQNIVKEDNIYDAQEVSQTPHYGPEGTFNGFKFHEPLGEKIDHIFVGNKFDVLRHGIISDSYELNYPSDHLPVLAEVKFKDEKITSRDRWAEELEIFENQIIDPKMTLFTGSSSIRLWKGLDKNFPKRKIVNTSFGGSEIRDLIINADKAIFNYNPKHIIIYSGDNDIWNGKSAALVASDFQELFVKIRIKFPDSHIMYISIKPSLARIDKIEEIKETNFMIREFLDSQPKAIFIDIFEPMMDDKENPDPSLFVEDRLHLSEKGYELWNKILKPYLRD
jgi:endonuclease/exonuclease/phosphatase family metal-dependent hydrolase